MRRALSGGSREVKRNSEGMLQGSQEGRVFQVNAADESSKMNSRKGK